MRKILAALVLTVLTASQLGMAQVVVCSQTMDWKTSAGCCAGKAQPTSNTCVDMCRMADKRVPLAPNRAEGVKAITDATVILQTAPVFVDTIVLGLTEITSSCGIDSIIQEPAVAIFVLHHSFLI